MNETSCKLLAWILCVFCAGIVSCGTPPPARPAQVPASAEWIGGPEEEVWIECSLDTERGVNRRTVFDDYKGRVALKGDFVLEGLGGTTRNS